MRNGFILMTAIIVIFALIFLALIESTYLQVTERNVDQYYEHLKNFHQQESLQSLLQWQSKNH
jgi:hypothetical protein